MLCAQCTVRRTWKCARCAAHRSVRRTLPAGAPVPCHGINKLISSGESRKHQNRSKLCRQKLLQPLQATSESLILRISSAESRQLMICAVVMDPRFKLFASKLCTSVRGESAQEKMVWATVKDMAIQHWKFEEEEQSESQADGAIMSPPH